MKKLAFLFLLFSIKSYSQSTPWETFTALLQVKNLTMSTLEKQQIKYRDNDLKKNGALDIHKLFSRKIHQEYKQNLYSLCKVNPDNTITDYILNILSINEEIIMLALNNENTDSIIIIKKTPQYKNLTQSWENTFEFKINSTHKYFNPCDLVYVGFYCTPAQKEAKEIKSLILNKDKDEIINWCLSLSPEIRCYGAIGLWHLKKRGMKLEEKEIKLMNQIKKERILIYTCNVCKGDGLMSSIWNAFYFGKKLRFPSNDRA